MPSLPDPSHRLTAWKDWVAGITERARAGHESGRSFYVERLNLGGTEAGWTTQGRTPSDDVAGALQAIESVGWRLYHIGYVYQPLAERSHMLTDSARLTGHVLGIYTFRRDEPDEAGNGL
jgi:hypothetical protein